MSSDVMAIGRRIMVLLGFGDNEQVPDERPRTVALKTCVNVHRSVLSFGGTRLHDAERCVQTKVNLHATMKMLTLTILQTRTLRSTPRSSRQ
jgi:hypothetical protein